MPPLISWSPNTRSVYTPGVLDLRPCHFEAGRCFSVIRNVTGALNRVRCKQIEKPVLHIRGVNMHADDLAYGQVLMELCAIKIMQLDNLDKPALKCRRGCGQNGASISELGEGVFFSFREYPPTGGLCRIILDLNFDRGRFHGTPGQRGAWIRHDPAFGIAPQFVGCEARHSRLCGE